MEFLKTWYQTCIRPEQVIDVFESWLSAHQDWADGVPSLVFTRHDHDFTPFWPKRSIEIVGVSKKADAIRLELRYKIENGISDPWYERTEPRTLPEVVRDFLRINSDEDSIYITLGPNIDWWKRVSRYPTPCAGIDLCEVG